MTVYASQSLRLGRAITVTTVEIAVFVIPTT